MPYQTSSGKTLTIDRAFTLNNEQFPSNWLRLASAKDKESRGISWVEAPKQNFKDKKFWNNVVTPDGTVTSTPKDIEGLREDLMAKAKRTTYSLLAPTDYMVIRSIDEEERMIDSDWDDYRDAVRVECRRLCEEYKQADFEAIQVVKPSWPESPTEKVERLKREALEDGKPVKKKKVKSKED